MLFFGSPWEPCPLSEHGQQVESLRVSSSFDW